MGKSRLEAFSDGVLAIIITIMVLELKVPHADQWDSLIALWPVFLSYALSYVYIGIYWNNHHHMLHTVTQVDSKILWANMNLLFWLSLVPFATGWIGHTHFSKLPVCIYGVILLLSAISYYLLQSAIIAHQGEGSILKKAVGNDKKGKISPFIYILGIVLSCYSPHAGMGLFVFAALLWLIPDQRIERQMR